MTTVANILFPALALAMNCVAGYAAFRRGSVDGSGAVAGTVVGTIILAFGGFLYWIMLMLFFVSSSVASRAGDGRKQKLGRMHERGNRRDYVQVAANGGIAALLVVALRVTSEPAIAVAAAGAFASVNADTWASEFGVLGARRPRSIITGRLLEPGTSGGVSLLGTGAAAAGSLLIAGFFALGQFATVPASPAVVIWSAEPTGLAAGVVFLIVWTAGLVGTTIDSLLGAALQAQYRAPDGSTTERPRDDGRPNELLRGVRAVNNDIVNVLSSLAAAAAGGAAMAVFG